jgi:helicase MOV-10
VSCPSFSSPVHNPPRLVKLVNNFRSHAQILTFPNMTFYGGDLRARASPTVVNVFEQWRHHPRPRRRFPVIFHAIAGQDEREAASPSYFNRLEAIQVKNYVQLLLQEGKVGAYLRLAPIQMYRLMVRQRRRISVSSPRTVRHWSPFMPHIC